jgi:hypothetical protein
MDDIHVQRLTLKLSGLDAAQGRRLATLITQGLAAATFKDDVESEQAAVRVDFKASRFGSLGLVSDRVVAEVLRQLERSR